MSLGTALRSLFVTTPNGAIRSTFRGGIHPPEGKGFTHHKPIQDLPPPSRVIVPLVQHIGAPCRSLVAVGDAVGTGQKIGEPEGRVGSPVHASVSGRITAIGRFPHPSGQDLPALIIESDGEDQWVDLEAHEDYPSLPPDALREAIRDAGVVGLGGAAFPTHVKLSPPPDKAVSTLILNGVECEPYLTCDHRIMVEAPQEIVEGFKILMRVLGVHSGLIGIERNKPDAIAAMRRAVEGEPGMRVVDLPVKYPQGAEKQLIQVLLGKEVPAGGLPADVGVVVQNVMTAQAIYHAVRHGRPLVERVVTVTGEGIRDPQNLRVRIGTPVSALIDACGGFLDEPGKVIVGGPLMGIAQYSLGVPVVKGTSGVVVLPKPAVEPKEESHPCIRCGRCVDACPMSLVPSHITLFSEMGNFEETERYHIFDCIECGICGYVCPSHRPMVQLIRFAKSALKARRLSAAADRTAVPRHGAPAAAGQAH